MNPFSIIQNLTSEDVQRYARIGLQWLASFLVTHGTIKSGATWVEPTIGVLVGLASFAWTIYGNRVKAKMIEVEKAGAIVVTTAEMAKATPDSPNIVSQTEVKVVPK